MPRHPSAEQADAIRIKTRRVSDLVVDPQLSPRARVKYDRIHALVEALMTGKDLPPIVTDKRTSRVVDGHYRVEAYRRVYGHDATVATAEKDYADAGELFLAAIELNVAHGSLVVPNDYVHCIATARRLALDMDRVTVALSMTPSFRRSLVYTSDQVRDLHLLTLLVEYDLIDRQDPRVQQGLSRLRRALDRLGCC